MYAEIIRELVQAWQSDAKARRVRAPHDPVAEALDCCGREVEAAHLRAGLAPEPTAPTVVALPPCRRCQARDSDPVEARLRDEIDLLKAARQQLERERARHADLNARLVAMLQREVWDRPAYPPSAGAVLCDGSEAIAVYALVDPQDIDRVRYVGQTKHPRTRYESHCRSMGWARDLWEKHQRRPVMIMLAWAPSPGEALRIEREQIAHFRRQGMADLNISFTRGVEGV